MAEPFTLYTLKQLATLPSKCFELCKLPFTGDLRGMNLQDFRVSEAEGITIRQGHPDEPIKLSRSRYQVTGHLSRRFTLQSSVNPVFAVIVFECIQFPFQIDGMSEQNLIEILASDRTDQPFDEGMGDRYVRYRFNLLDTQKFGPRARATGAR